MSAENIKKIRTQDGDLSLDYNALDNRPEALKNPNKIIFTGAVSAEYDGSETVIVNIPTQIRTDTNTFTNVNRIGISNANPIFNEDAHTLIIEG